MRCPKCQFDHELQTTECLKCGIIFARYQAVLDQEAAAAAARNEAEAAAAKPAAPSAPEKTMYTFFAPDPRKRALNELKCRILALPLALLFARMIAGTGLRLAESMLAMVLHESGHAITAWLTGRWAVPLLWVTPHGQYRSWLIVVGLMAAILFGGFLAWRAQRWGWVYAAGAVLLLQLIVLRSPAEQLIIFFGDGGALVLATLLMATFYAPRDSKLYKSWGLRWGLLVVGAMAFMHTYLLWTGPYGDLPFGEIEGVNLSDPSLLTQVYNWSVIQLVDRYVLLGKICLVFLLALYGWGLFSTYRELRVTSNVKSNAVASR